MTAPVGGSVAASARGPASIPGPVSARASIGSVAEAASPASGRAACPGLPAGQRGVTGLTGSPQLSCLLRGTGLCQEMMQRVILCSGERGPG